MLVGFDSADDAAVVQLTDQLCLIHTVDFFPPMIDDPYLFGAIAATNALSDVYAMGGQVVSALNLLSTTSCLPLDMVKQILHGGNDKVIEAGVNVSGGHSIEETEPKYGLAVCGIVDKDKIWRNDAVREGDHLILTKALGSGILNTAYRADLLTPESQTAVIATMTRLNRYASEAAQKLGTVHACTDITGFGLLGHLQEMLTHYEGTARVQTRKVPVLPHALELARDGFVPGAAYRNRTVLTKSILVPENFPRDLLDLLLDPQTSGGLLFAVAEADAPALIEAIRAGGDLAVDVATLEPWQGHRIILEA